MPAAGYKTPLPVVNNFANTNSQTLAITGAAYNYASAGLQATAGAATLSGSSLNYTVDFGSLSQHNGVITETLQLSNLGPASAYTDLLDGSFSANLGGAFTTSAASFSNLAGGNGLTLDIGFNAADAGSFNGDLQFNLLGHDAGGYSGGLGTLNINLAGNIAAVPEPEQWFMLVVGMGMLGWRVRTT